MTLVYGLPDGTGRTISDIDGDFRDTGPPDRALTILDRNPAMAVMDQAQMGLLAGHAVQDPEPGSVSTPSGVTGTPE